MRDNRDNIIVVMQNAAPCGRRNIALRPGSVRRAAGRACLAQNHVPVYAVRGSGKQEVSKIWTWKCRISALNISN